MLSPSKTILLTTATIAADFSDLTVLASPALIPVSPLTDLANIRASSGVRHRTSLPRPSPSRPQGNIQPSRSLGADLAMVTANWFVV